MNKIEQGQVKAINAGQLIRVPVSQLKGASFNPKGRTTLAKCRGLMESIRQSGILSPILVTEDFEIGDGHRRDFCAEQLQFDEVWVKVCKGMTAEEIYKVANSHTLRTNGNETLRIYLMRDGACSDKAWANFRTAEDKYGRDLLEFIAEQGGSLSTLNIVTRILTYCSKVHNALNASIVAKYLLLKKRVDNTRWAMSHGTSPQVIWDKILNMEIIIKSVNVYATAVVTM